MKATTKLSTTMTTSDHDENGISNGNNNPVVYGVLLRIATVNRKKKKKKQHNNDDNTATVEWYRCVASNNVDPSLVQILTKSSYIKFLSCSMSPIEYNGRHSNMDCAIILEAMKEYTNRNNSRARTIIDHVHDDQSSSSPTTTTTTTTTTLVDLSSINRQLHDGNLPIVPIRRSQSHQLCIKQSVNLFFNRFTIQYFACQPLRYSPRTIYRFSCKQKYIALTIDDAPCRFNTPGSSLLPQVLNLLSKYEANATFMSIQQYLSYKANESSIIRLLKQGHELANHGSQDESMTSLSEEEFKREVEKCNTTIQTLHEKAGLSARIKNKWFRAPHGQYTKTMESALTKLGMYNVMCDVYAVDPIVEDSEWIGTTLAQQARSGSIILIHMPEIGFRQYNLRALEVLLDTLTKQGYQIVTVSQLEKISIEQKE
jgi:peptidoglycan/xylan/chitin deacetylase (PgdA/CDA1 family)